MKIGIAGAGRLGSAVCERLLRQGLQVSLWNRTPGRTAHLEALGAVACVTTHELVQASDVVMTLLTDADALQAVYLGAQGLLSGDLAGKTFVEMSTVRPQVQRDLAAAVIKAGASFVECPVAGSKDAALSGTLIAIAAGEADDVARVRPVLEQLCKRIEHVGPVGSAASVKLAVNLPLIVYFQVLSEALTLIDHLHLDPHRVIGLLAESTGGPNFLRVRGGSLADALNGA
ncbi:MAG: 3-hydroxyisobutyrate dehydrogenase, partial [Rhizobacter sp.]|nr:3-hydroxyisobutyrate dehydrogenase [Rhizobacter sp.]